MLSIAPTPFCERAKRKSYASKEKFPRPVWRSPVAGRLREATPV